MHTATFINKLSSLCFVCTLLAACSSAPSQTETSSQNNDSTQMSQEEFKNYLANWQEKLTQVDKLASLEGDLALLIDEINKSNKLKKLPNKYANLAQIDVHQAPPTEDSNNSTNTAKESGDLMPKEGAETHTGRQLYAAQLAVFLHRQEAKRHWTRMSQRYPKLAARLQPFIVPVSNKQAQTAVYSLMVGPTEKMKTAQLLCRFFLSQSYHCQAKKLPADASQYMASKAT